MKEFLSQLSEVSKSPYSFVAYVLLIVAWVIIGLRVNRNKQLLKNLEKLPEKDRLKVLELEMGTPRLKSGISPEQWLKARTQKFLFLGFTLVLLLILMIFVLSITTYSKRKRADFDVTLFSPQSENIDSLSDEEAMMAKLIDKYTEGDLKYPSYDYQLSMSGLMTEPNFRTLKINYNYTSTKQEIQIFPTFPYLDTIKSDGTLIGFRYWRQPFKTKFPIMSIKVVNNTEETIFLSEAKFSIIKSEINKEPLPIFVEDFYNVGSFKLQNEGWGKMFNVKLSYKIVPPPDDLVENDFAHLEKKMSFPFIENDTSIRISDLLSDSIRNNHPYVCVMGILEYSTEDQIKRTLRFKTRVSLRHPPPGVPAPPTQIYDLFLEAGKSNYQIVKPISQSIKPGESDHFLFYIGTDKSSSYEMTLSLKTVNGLEFNEKSIALQMILPKSCVEYLRDKNKP